MERVIDRPRGTKGAVLCTEIRDIFLFKQKTVERNAVHLVVALDQSCPIRITAPSIVEVCADGHNAAISC